MSDGDAQEAMRQAARDVLRELMPSLLAEARGNGNGNGAHVNGNGDHPAAPIVPVVPAPPIAAVLRPSTWAQPPAPGEVIGDISEPARAADEPVASAAEPTDPNAEPVTIDSDEDLDRFVRALAARLDNPRDRRLIHTGKLRFTLRRTAAPGPRQSGAEAAPRPAMRVEKGAVTERTVKEASAAGARLVLARRAVITPLARDQARALGVQIEREGRC
jgi:hypothetical protein